MPRKLKRQPLAAPHVDVAKIRADSIDQIMRTGTVAMRGAGRKNARSCVDPAQCEMDYTQEELEFLRAIDRYRSATHKPFPTYAEVLGIAKSIGCRKVMAEA